MVSEEFVKHLEPLLFPVKLFNLAHSNEIKSVYWSREGTAVKLDTNLMPKECFDSRIFNVVDCKHIFRQLSYYRFQRIQRTGGVWEFHHPYFLANRLDLVETIKRIGKKNRGTTLAFDIKSVLPFIERRKSSRLEKKEQQEQKKYFFKDESESDTCDTSFEEVKPRNSRGRRRKSTTLSKYSKAEKGQSRGRRKGNCFDGNSKEEDLETYERDIKTRTSTCNKRKINTAKSRSAAVKPTPTFANPRNNYSSFDVTFKEETELGLFVSLPKARKSRSGTRKVDYESQVRTSSVRSSEERILFDNHPQPSTSGKDFSLMQMYWEKEVESEPIDLKEKGNEEHVTEPVNSPRRSISKKYTNSVGKVDSSRHATETGKNEAIPMKTISKIRLKKNVTNISLDSSNCEIGHDSYTTKISSRKLNDPENTETFKNDAGNLDCMLNSSYSIVQNDMSDSADVINNQFSRMAIKSENDSFADYKEISKIKLNKVEKCPNVSAQFMLDKDFKRMPVCSYANPNDCKNKLPINKEPYSFPLSTLISKPDQDISLSPRSNSFLNSQIPIVIPKKIDEFSQNTDNQLKSSLNAPNYQPPNCNILKKSRTNCETKVDETGRDAAVYQSFIDEKGLVRTTQEQIESSISFKNISSTLPSASTPNAYEFKSFAKRSDTKYFLRDVPQSSAGNLHNSKESLYEGSVETVDGKSSVVSKDRRNRPKRSHHSRNTLTSRKKVLSPDNVTSETTSNPNTVPQSSTSYGNRKHRPKILHHSSNTLTSRKQVLSPDKLTSDTRSSQNTLPQSSTSYENVSDSSSRDSSSGNYNKDTNGCFPAMTDKQPDPEITPTEIKISPKKEEELIDFLYSEYKQDNLSLFEMLEHPDPIMRECAYQAVTRDIDLAVRHTYIRSFYSP